MPRVSIVVPVYNNERYLDQCLLSLRAQTHRDIEIVVVDDASTDGSAARAERHAAEDPRVRVLRLAKNTGTLGARKAGITASTGDYVTLIDQDDELVPQALENLVAYAAAHPADIYHFAVQVAAENDAARDARAGMTGFLTPTPRRIEGADILKIQLAEHDGFDWHVHHKLYRGDLARACWAKAADARLVLADDIYMCFILAAEAKAYEAVPDSAWYVYHLGRGETYGSMLTAEAYERLAAADGRALALAASYAENPGNAPARADWPERLCDLRDRLAFHALNEWQDNVPDALKDEGIEAALAHLAPDAVAGELYRFVRDYAYALLQCPDRTSDEAYALEEQVRRYLAWARRAEERAPFDAGNARYQAMKAIACGHLVDCGLMPRPAEEPKAPRASLAERLRRLLSARRGRTR